MFYISRGNNQHKRKNLEGFGVLKIFVHIMEVHVISLNILYQWGGKFCLFIVGLPMIKWQISKGFSCSELVNNKDNIILKNDRNK